MVLPSCRPVSPPAPGVPNSSGTSVSATDQRIPRLRLHTRRSAQPPAESQTTGQLYSTWFWITSIVNFLRLSKALCCSLWLSVNTATSANLPWFIFYRVQRQNELPRRAAILPSSKVPPGSGSPALKPHYRAGQATWPRPQGPSHGTGIDPGCYLRSSFQSPHDPPD